MSASRLARSWDGSRNTAPERRVSFAIERLEEILLFSAAPTEISAIDWRQQTFSLDSVDLQANLGDFGGGTVSAQTDSGIQMIGAVHAQQQYGLSGAGYSVVIIDTGIDYNNPAFAGRYLGGWNFVDNNSNTMDYNGHGTHVAGIIGSADPSHLGIAPGVGIISLKVLDNSGAGTFGNVDLALQWVAAHQAQYHIAAVNMSLGSGNYTAEPFNMLDSDLQTLANQGVFIAAASGNSYFSYGSQPGLAFPAINNSVVSVGAVWDGNFGSASWANGAKDYTTASDQITSFTQRNAMLDILAPGAYVTSTYLSNSFASMAGTSMASPMVAAAAVLIHQALDMKGQGSLADESHILQIMKATGVSIVDSGHGQDNVNHTGLTFKRLDVFSALESILGGAYSPPPSHNPPSSNFSPNAAFVTALYQEVLGRAVDPAGLNAWVNRLNAGTSRLQLAQMLWNSAEHRAHQVAEDYVAFLHRAPGAAEVNTWVNIFLAGASEDQVADAFLHSHEYLWSNAANSSYVQKLFQDILGRPADSAGLADWTAALDQGIVGRSQLADLVLHSNERNLNLIGEYYQEFLGRSASTAEKQGWATLVESGLVSLQSVAQAFLASQEFYSHSAGANGLGLTDLSLNPSPDGTSNGSLLPWTSDFAAHSRAFDGWAADDDAAAGELGGANQNSNLPAYIQQAYPWSDPSGSISLRIGSSQVVDAANAERPAEPPVQEHEAPAENDEDQEADRSSSLDEHRLDAQDRADLAMLSEIEAILAEVRQALAQ